jgi:hypothetical protein
MKLERAVPCARRLRLGRTPFGIMTVPGIVIAISVAIATLIMGLHT